MTRARGGAAVAAVALAVLGCNPPLKPAVAPTATFEGVTVRVDSMVIGSAAPEARAATGATQLAVRVRAPEGTRLERALLTRTTRAPCSGGSEARQVLDAGLAQLKLPAPAGGERALTMGFFATPEEALEAPTALDVETTVAGMPACVRTPLGPAEAWERTQWAFDVSVRGGAPLGALGDVGTVWTVDERVGVLVGDVDLSAGLRLGLASCGECYEHAAVLDGPVVAATYYVAPASRSTLALELSYAALFEQMHYPDDPQGSNPYLREWYQVPGVALQWAFLAPPRGSHVRLRGKDFTAWGLEAWEQTWIPTLHAGRPGVLLGLGFVSRLAL